MNKQFAQIILLAGTVFCFSCNNAPSNNHGPIVLGDSSAIVTEEDPQKLKDLVTDLKPVIPPSENKDSTEEKAPEAKPDADKDKDKKVTTTAPAPPPQVAVAGLKAEFKEVTFLLPNVSAKQAGKPNLQNANGAVYTLTGGTIAGNQIRTTGTVTKVSQRYQSIVMLKYDNNLLPLESLSTTTSWEPLKGGKDVYYITGLDAASLEYPDEDANSIRNAVTRSAQRHRISKKKIQDLVSSVKRVKAANQKPLVVALRSVMWKIDGKDAQGRPYSKQIRIDIPM